MLQKEDQTHGVAGLFRQVWDCKIVRNHDREPPVLLRMKLKDVVSNTLSKERQGSSWVGAQSGRGRKRCGEKAVREGAKHPCSVSVTL